MPTFPLGHHAHQQRLANALRLARTGPAAPVVHVHAGFEFPDPVDLRGIPALARDVGGTMPGTQPERQVTR